MTTGLNSIENVFETPAKLAVKIAGCAEFTAAMVAVKPALVEFAGTMTETGTAADASLLERFTVDPPLGAAALKVTVQASVPAPVIDPLVQASALRAAAGFI